MIGIQGGLSCTATPWDQELSLDARQGERAAPLFATIFRPHHSGKQTSRKKHFTLFHSPRPFCFERLQADFTRAKNLFSPKAIGIYIKYILILNILIIISSILKTIIELFFYCLHRVCAQIKIDKMHVMRPIFSGETPSFGRNIIYILIKCDC